MKVQGTIYVLESSLGHYKIGCSRQLDRRLTTFGIKLPFEVSLLAAIDVDDMYYYESWLHSFFSENRLNGEWFILNYSSLELIVEYLKTQQELDDFINWFQLEETQGEIYIKKEFGFTAASLYCSEKMPGDWFLGGSKEHIATRQTEIDKAANEIWGLEPWDL